jgi:prepilin-type N-terminal cleavage/methylation domain-containing protein
MMNSNTDSPADSGERGFTLTEALAAIGIISILTALVLSFLSSSITSSARSKDTLFFFKDMLLADEKIRELAGEVVIPYWERVSELIPGNGTALEIPWYGGRKENVLRIQIDPQGRLSMNAPINGGPSTYTAPVSLTVNAADILRDGTGNPAGLRIRYDYRGKPCYTTAIFGSLPVRKRPYD